jgi:transcriptional regulator with XRE-family HTH domain
MTADQFKALRKRTGLTQVDVAGRLGVDPMTISRWERGLHPINPLAVPGIRAALQQKQRHR